MQHEATPMMSAALAKHPRVRRHDRAKGLGPVHAFEMCPAQSVSRIEAADD
jgi:hypothetical protein